MTRQPHTLLAMTSALAPRLFDAGQQRRLTDLVRIDPQLVIEDFHTDEGRAALATTEILITGWECPVITEETLAAAPHLKAIVHAGGSVKHHITDACWRRGIQVSSATAANALPVAEYTLAMILLANKRILPLRQEYQDLGRDPGWAHWTALHPHMGNYRRKIGVVGCSTIGRRLIGLLKDLDLKVVVYDPYLEETAAAALGVTKVNLDELVSVSDVVTLHAPALPETTHMIDRRRLAMMKDGATLINTARGSLVDTEALLEEVRRGRLDAVLDVVEPAPAPDSPLFDLPNLLLTPHIAGSHGTELHRIGELVLDELERHLTGRAFEHAVRPELLAQTA